MQDLPPGHSTAEELRVALEKGLEHMDLLVLLAAIEGCWWGQQACWCGALHVPQLCVQNAAHCVVATPAWCVA